MRGLLRLLIGGAVIAIGIVLFGGLGDTYELGDVAVLTGGMVLLAGALVVGGAFAALSSWGEVAIPTETGIAIQRAYRPRIMILAAVLFAVALFIVFTGSTDTFVSDLAVGSCFDDPEGLEVSTVNVLSCDEPHDNEVFAIVSLTNLGSSFPGQSTIDDEAVFRCFPRFEGYVGSPYEVSILDIATLNPTADSWAQGDREVTCALYRLDGEAMVGSMRGSGL